MGQISSYFFVGRISLSEMEDIFLILHKEENGAEIENQEDMKDISRKAEDMFFALDEDGDGELTQEEFIRGCVADEDLMRQLNTS